MQAALGIAAEEINHFVDGVDEESDYIAHYGRTEEVVVVVNDVSFQTIEAFAD